MGTRTSEELKQLRIKVLGLEFGVLYNSIYNEFLWILFKWAEYKELFGVKESRIKILNEAAPQFFFVVQKVLWENLLLGICKLTDPPKSFGKKNVTIRALPPHIGDEVFKSSIVDKINQILESSEFCRDWRNRYISHKDFILATDKNAVPLKSASQEKISHVFIEFQNLINLFQGYYFNSETDFESVQSFGGAISMLIVLDEGIESRKERQARVKSGTYTEQDLIRKDI